MDDSWVVIVEFVCNVRNRGSIISTLKKYVREDVQLTTNMHGNPFLKIATKGSSARHVINHALERFDDDTLQGQLVPVGVRAYPTASREPVPDLVGLTEVAQMLGVTRQRASQLSSQAEFPIAIARLAMGPVYTGHSISDFKDRWSRKVGRPRLLKQL